MINVPPPDRAVPIPSHFLPLYSRFLEGTHSDLPWNVTEWWTIDTFGLRPCLVFSIQVLKACGISVSPTPPITKASCSGIWAVQGSHHAKKFHPEECGVAPVRACPSVHLTLINGCPYSVEYCRGNLAAMATTGTQKAP